MQIDTPRGKGTMKITRRAKTRIQISDAYFSAPSFTPTPAIISWATQKMHSPLQEKTTCIDKY